MNILAIPSYYISPLPAYIATQERNFSRLNDLDNFFNQQPKDIHLQNGETHLKQNTKDISLRGEFTIVWAMSKNHRGGGNLQSTFI